jgi:hypothetical protein
VVSAGEQRWGQAAARAGAGPLSWPSVTSWACARPRARSMPRLCHATWRWRRTQPRRVLDLLLPESTRLAGSGMATWCRGRGGATGIESAGELRLMVIRSWGM